MKTFKEYLNEDSIVDTIRGALRQDKELKCLVRQGRKDIKGVITDYSKDTVYVEIQETKEMKVHIDDVVLLDKNDDKLATIKTALRQDKELKCLVRQGRKDIKGTIDDYSKDTVYVNVLEPKEIKVPLGDIVLV